MDERGWDWPASETRRAQLVEWIVQRSAEEGDGVYVPLDSFYGALPDQSMNTYVIALDDVNSLEGRSLLDLANSFGGVESLAAQSTSAGRAFVDNLQAARSNTARRRLACRDAMVDWLYSRDAVSPPGVDRDGMLHDRRGYFFAEPFTADDLDAAAAWLYRNSLVGGAMIAEAQGPVVLYLTDSGVKCAEDFSSDTSAYFERQVYRAPAPTVNIGTSGPVQVAGDDARQVQKIGTSANDLGTGPRPEPGRATNFAGNRKAVMVVYGHDKEANDALFGWLRAIGLQPREWSQLIRASGSASPFIGEVLDKALHDVQAVVAFFTPDEYVTAAGTDHARGRFQARPNVLIEAGMALITHPTRTIIAVLGNQELPSDLAGRHYVRLSHTGVQPLHDLAGRLGDAGCDIDLSGSDWLNPDSFPDRDRTVPPAGEHPASQTAQARTAAGPPGKDRTHDGDAEDLPLRQAASAEPAGERHDASTETRRHEGAQRARQDTEARQVLVTIKEARPGERFTHLITVSTPITYPVKQVEAQIAWQANSGLGTTSTGFVGDPPRVDGQRRYYTFRASVNPQIHPEPVIRFVDLHGNRYCQFRDHTQRFPANTDWTQALTAIDKWLRTGPTA